MLARVGWTHNELAASALVLLSLAIGLEEDFGFTNQFASTSDDRERSTMVDINVGKVEPHNMELFAVHNHHLAVIADEISGGSGHSDSARKESHLEVTKRLFASAVGEGDQRLDKYSALHGIHERAFDLRDIKAEDQD